LHGERRQNKHLFGENVDLQTHIEMAAQSAAVQAYFHLLRSIEEKVKKGE